MRVQQIFQLYLCAFIAVSTARLPVHNSHHEGKDATVSEISNGGVKLILNSLSQHCTKNKSNLLCYALFLKNTRIRGLTKDWLEKTSAFTKYSAKTLDNTTRTN